MFRTLKIILLFSVELFFWGCTSLEPLRVKADLPPSEIGRLPTQPVFHLANSRDCDGAYCVHIVEYDEFGNAFSRAQLDAGIAAAKAVAETGGAVIVYVHGWHHSAKSGDGNIREFLATVVQSAQRMQRKTIGIYVGWRGDSIDSDNMFLKLPSYALTFWDRKATAHAIGHGGGVSELIRKLSVIRANNEQSQLMILGHSFGGAIVYSAVSQLLAEQISLDSSSDSDSFVSRYEFRPIADLVVLLNPAFEAIRMAPLYSLARSNEYQRGVAPRVIVITSTADWATRITFPLGRYIGTLFKGYHDKSMIERDRTAIGHYIPYVTHQLIAGKCGGSSVQSNEKILLELTGSKDYEQEICFEGSRKDRSLILTRCDTQSDCKYVTDGHFITRGPAEEGYIPRRFPIANIRTNETVMRDHGDIWDPDLKLFLLGLLDVANKRPEKIPLE